MKERLREAVALLIEYYNLPLNEVRDLLYEEDYPPLEPGDLGAYETAIFEE